MSEDTPKTGASTETIVMSVLALLALPLTLVFYVMFAATGGSGDCAVAPSECASISTRFGLAALFFFLLEVFSIWRIFRLARKGIK